jgi:hypothetical protein
MVQRSAPLNHQQGPFAKVAVLESDFANGPWFFLRSNARHPRQVKSNCKRGRKILRQTWLRVHLWRRSPLCSEWPLESSQPKSERMLPCARAMLESAAP